MEDRRVRVQTGHDRIDFHSLRQQIIGNFELAVLAGEVERLVNDVMPGPLAPKWRFSSPLALETIWIR